jgi:hypothetical protein
MCRRGGSKRIRNREMPRAPSDESLVLPPIEAWYTVFRPRKTGNGYRIRPGADRAGICSHNLEHQLFASDAYTREERG